VNPPHRITVDMTITRVVEKMARCCIVEVLRIANANAIAPRKPAHSNIKQSIQNEQKAVIRTTVVVKLNTI